MGENTTVIFFTGLPRVNTRGLREKHRCIVLLFTNLLSDQTWLILLIAKTLWAFTVLVSVPNLRRCVFLEIYLHFKAIPVTLARVYLLFIHMEIEASRKKKEQARKTSRAPWIQITFFHSIKLVYYAPKYKVSKRYKALERGFIGPLLVREPQETSRTSLFWKSVACLIFR